jgi:hypothetical protein
LRQLRPKQLLIAISVLRAYGIFLLKPGAVPDHVLAHSEAFGAKQKFHSEVAEIISNATGNPVNFSPSQRRKQN